MKSIDPSLENSELSKVPAVSHSDMAGKEVATPGDFISLSSDTTPATTNMSIPALDIGAEMPSGSYSVAQTTLPQRSPDNVLTPLNCEPSSSTTLPMFTLYPKLPIELRNKIIHHCIPHFPRIVQVRRSDFLATKYSYDVMVSSTNPLLQVNSDFRNEVGRHYVSSFTLVPGSARTMSSLRVNWEIDTLFINTFGASTKSLDGLWDDLFGENIEHVKSSLCKLAGSAIFIHGFWNQVLGQYRGIQQMPAFLASFAVFDGFVKLEEVISIVGPYTIRNNRLLRFKETKKEHPLYKKNVAWFQKGFNRASDENGGQRKRTGNVVARLCYYYGTMNKEADEMMGVRS